MTDANQTKPQEQSKQPINKKKSQINATVSEWIKIRCEQMVADPTSGMASVSDLVSQALSEYFGRYDYIRKEMQKTEAEKFREMARDVLLEINEKKGNL